MRRFRNDMRGESGRYLNFNSTKLAGEIDHKTDLKYKYNQAYVYLNKTVPRS